MPCELLLKQNLLFHQVENSLNSKCALQQINICPYSCITFFLMAKEILSLETQYYHPFSQEGVGVHKNLHDSTELRETSMKERDAIAQDLGDMVVNFMCQLVWAKGCPNS